MYKMYVAIHSIYNFIIQCFGYFFTVYFFCIKIITIEYPNYISSCHFKPLVHGIIQAFVRFADQGMDVLAVTVDDVQSVVFGTSVYNDVFHIPVGLGNDTLDGVFQHGTGVVRHGDDGELGLQELYESGGLSDYKS